MGDIIERSLILIIALAATIAGIVIAARRKKARDVFAKSVNPNIGDIVLLDTGYYGKVVGFDGTTVVVYADKEETNQIVSKAAVVDIRPGQAAESA